MLKILYVKEKKYKYINIKIIHIIIFITMSDYEELMPTEEEIVRNRIQDFKSEGITDLQILNFYKNKPKLLPIAQKIINGKKAKSVKSDSESDSDEEIVTNRSKKVVLKKEPIKKEPIKKETVVKKSTISMDSFFNEPNKKEPEVKKSTISMDSFFSTDVKKTSKEEEIKAFHDFGDKLKLHREKIEQELKEKAEKPKYANTKDDEKEAKQLVDKYKKEGKNNYEILDLFFFDHPILYNISNKLLFNKFLSVKKMAKEAKELTAKITKENQEFEKERKEIEKLNKKKPLSIKKMAKETKELSNKIMNENEEWNKSRKEIKYLNVKPKKEKILKLSVNLVTNKEGKNMNIDSEFFTDNFTIKMLKDITNDILTKGREKIKQRKREGRMI